MFEYGKDIPLDGVAVKLAAQQENTEEQEISEGAVFRFDHSKDIPLHGIK